jgi:2-C-methyl-D-erythritol 4-phosphate cytidylyltransferase/2-C-methyl-D-erythritol 2,4-cyclodiphosphate synthase
VIRDSHRAAYDASVAGLDLLPPVDGGETRQASVLAGLEALVPEAPDLVLIHDAARPLVSPSVVGGVVNALGSADGAIAALPVVDTLRRVEGGFGAGTVPRDGLWAAQTPQGFRFPAILAAHRAAAGMALTDDAAVAEEAGLAVAMVEGDRDNFKITTEDDLVRAERLLAGPPDIRVGQGFDVHRFAAGGEHVMLCGIAVPYGRGVDAHSDGDVGLHAATDAILGAIAAGDIGQHFPPSDMRWRGADSAVFLRHAGDLAARRGTLLNLDLTILCEAPKVGPHRRAMAERIAAILGLETDRVSIKATTTERLGFLGRGEGIAAQATATVRIER